VNGDRDLQLSDRWAPATYGSFSVLASKDDQERARQLWERHLVLDVGGDRQSRDVRGAAVPDGR
jgi:hypothetical protein